MINDPRAIEWLQSQPRASIHHEPITFHDSDYPQTKNNCFQNSTHAVLGRKHTTYCEGLVMTPRSGDLMIPHAWCFDEEHQCILDQTLPDCTLYWGVKIPYDILKDHILTQGYYGVLFDHLGFTRVTVDRHPHYFKEKELA